MGVGMKYAMNFICLMMCLTIQTLANAQKCKIVQGKVLDKRESEKKNAPIPLAYNECIKIFCCETVQEAAKLFEEIENNVLNLSLIIPYETPNKYGEYVAFLPEKGALLITGANTFRPVLEKMENGEKVVTYLDVWHEPVCEIIPLYRKLVSYAEIDASVIPKNRTIFLEPVVCLPDGMGKTDARMVLQLYVVNKSKSNEIVLKHSPRVYEGKEYGLVQTRIAKYSKQKDSLAAYVQNMPLLKKGKKYKWRDIICLPNDDDIFQVLLSVRLIDYKKIYYENIIPVYIDKPKYLLHLLEYPFEDLEMILTQTNPGKKQYELAEAFNACLNGRYKIMKDISAIEAETRNTFFQRVRKSSLINNIVMCLAMRTPYWNQEARKLLAGLHNDDPRMFYLKTLLHCREGDMGVIDAELALFECFKRDKKYIPIAEADGDINEECFKYAKLDYDDWLKDGVCR